VLAIDIDSKTGNTIDTWFPRNNKQIRRRCLAEKVGLIKGEFIEVGIESLFIKPSLQYTSKHSSLSPKTKKATLSVALNFISILTYALCSRAKYS
jgi:hypothetical protein